MLVSRVAEAEARVENVRGQIGWVAERCLGRAEEALRRSERLARLAELRLEGKSQALDEIARRLGLLAKRRSGEAERKLDDLARRLASASRRSFDRRKQAPEELGRRLVARASAELDRQHTRVEGLARLLRSLEPQRVLERGYSITRSVDGRALSSPDQVRSGDRLTTRLEEARIIKAQG